MKYYPRLNVYKASNVTADLNKMTAYSWGWWKFLAEIDGKIVFNTFNYSISTAEHQWKVECLLKNQGIDIDIEIESPDGLQRLESAIEHYESKIKELETLIKKPRTHVLKNIDRQCQIDRYASKIKTVKKLLKKI